MKRKIVYGTIAVLVVIAGGLLIIVLQDSAADVERDIERALEPETKLRVTVPTRKPSTYDIRYEVGGTAKSASITIANKQGNTEQRTIKPTWITQFKAPDGQFVYVSAQNDTDKGQINCRIYQDGKLKEQAQSNGAYAIATCSMSAGD